MGMSKHIGAYSDIARVLDAAIAAGGATYTEKSPGAAIHWRQRAYTFRKLLHTQQQARLENILETRPTVTPYDGIQLVLDGPVITIRVERSIGQLRDGDGNPLELPDVLSGTPRHDAIDSLDDEDADMLADVRIRLGLEEE